MDFFHCGTNGTFLPISFWAQNLKKKMFAHLFGPIFFLFVQTGHHFFRPPVCHDGTAIMPCAKLWPNVVVSLHMRSTCFVSTNLAYKFINHLWCGSQNYYLPCDPISCSAVFDPVSLQLYYLKYVFSMMHIYNVDWQTYCVFYPLLSIISSPPSSTYMRQWTRSALVQVMACLLFGSKPLPGPKLAYCQFNSWE